MSDLRLRYKAATGQRIDLSAVTPALAARSADQVARIPLHLGRFAVPLGELFQVELRASDEQRLELLDSTAELDGIGAGLTEGRIEIFGDAGACLGRGLRGGSIIVHGDCGAYAGSRQRNGFIRIDGSAGDFLAGPLPGETRGMRGGVLLVCGSAGARAAERMRAGMLFIEGDAGPFCAARMIAGSVFVGGTLGPLPGVGMRRGSLLLAAEPTELPATFNDAGVHDFGFLGIMRRALYEMTIPAHFYPRDRHVQRWVGDRAVDGQGELLLALGGDGAGP